MDEYLSDEDVVEENFEYDGCPYSFEPEFTDEELIERRTRRQREDQLSREYCTCAAADLLLLQFRGQHSHKNMSGVTQTVMEE